MATFLFFQADGSITKSQNTVPTGTIQLTVPSLHFSLLSVKISQSQWHHEHSGSGRSSCEVSTDLRIRWASVGDWSSRLWASCLWEYILRPVSVPVHDTVRLLVAQGWRYYQFVSMLSHPSDTCHQRYFHRCCLPCFSPLRHASLSRLIRLAARCLSTLASPLAPWPELPSNNFISFPPLSRRPAPPLTIGCCFLPEKKKAQGYVGQVENPTIADSVLDTGQWYWWLQWGCMDQRSHTKGLPVSVHAELQSKWHGDVQRDKSKNKTFQNLKHSVSTKKWCSTAQVCLHLNTDLWCVQTQYLWWCTRSMQEAQLDKKTQLWKHHSQDTNSALTCSINIWVQLNITPTLH